MRLFTIISNHLAVIHFQDMNAVDGAPAQVPTRRRRSSMDTRNAMRYRSFDNTDVLKKKIFLMAGA